MADVVAENELNKAALEQKDLAMAAMLVAKFTRPDCHLHISFYAFPGSTLRCLVVISSKVKLYFHTVPSAMLLLCNSKSFCVSKRPLYSGRKLPFRKYCDPVNII